MFDGPRVVAQVFRLLQDRVELGHRLKEAGLSLSDVRVVPMPPNEMVAAFTNKNIDAYCVWEPAFSDGQKAALRRFLASL